MELKAKEKSGSFENKLRKFLEQLEKEKEALNKIMRSIENNNDKKTSIKKHNK
jgi:hypothetical protein